MNRIIIYPETRPEDNTPAIPDMDLPGYEVSIKNPHDTKDVTSMEAKEAKRQLLNMGFYNKPAYEL